MRLSHLPLLLGLLLVSVSPGFAQFPDPMVALAGRGGTMRCESFVHLSAGKRDRIVSGLNAAAPPTTLAPPTVTPPGVGADRQIVPNPSAGSVTGTPLTAGRLIAACEAASPRATLRGAYARFNSSRVPGTATY